MRTGFISPYPPIECGIATYTEALRNALLEQDSENFVVSPLGAQGTNVFPVYQQDSPSFVRNAFQTSTRLTPDVMHIQHEYGLFGSQHGVGVIELFLRLKLARIPTVATLHTVYNELNEQEHLILKSILDTCSAIIVHEDYQRETLARYFGENDRIHVIEHGIREIEGTPDTKAKLGLTGKKVILLAGYVRPSKGFHKFIDILPEICRQDNDIVLVVASKTRNLEYHDYYHQLHRDLEASPVADQIRVLYGQFPQYTFDTILSAADVVVLPYERGAQSGILSQCFAFKKPVVTSDLPSFINSINRCGGGFYCNKPEDYISKIYELLNDKQIYQNCQRNIENHIKNRAGWSHIAKQHLDVYHQIINAPSDKAEYFYIPEPKKVA